MQELYKDDMWRIQKETASLPDGRVKHVHRVYGPSTVTILPVLENGNLYVLREFRPFYGEYIWMLPSGKIDQEDNPLVAAHRELREEIGMDAKDMKEILQSRPTERIVMTNYTYVAHNLFEAPLPQDAEELIEVHELDPKIALENILASPVVQMPSAVALLLYMQKYRQ